MSRKKNIWPSVVITLILWVSLSLMIYFVQPNLVKNLLIPGIYLPFMLNVFLAVFFTLSLILKNRRRSLLISLSLVIFLLLRVLELGNILNLVLLCAIIITLETTFTKKG